MSTKKGIKLQFGIIILVVFSMFTTVFVNLYTATKTLKNSLTEESLNSNYNYAKKLALNTEDLLSSMQKNLAALTMVTSKNIFTQEDLDLWINAYKMDFNSIMVVDSEGVIQKLSPATLRSTTGEKIKTGVKVESSAFKRALTLREPFISDPYRAPSGRLLILLTAPIFDQVNNFKGLVGGTIYLEAENILRNMLKEHEHGDGSFVYVIDRTGRIIYHPDPMRINEVVMDNPLVKKMLRSEDGKELATDSEGHEFLIGYTTEKSTGWMIISQTPSSVLKEPLTQLLKDMVLHSIPFLIFIFLIAWLLSRSLSRSLSNLAAFSEDAINQKKIVPTGSLEIKSSIYEIRQLYTYIKSHIDLLNNQVQLDGLTGIANRKTFDSYMEEFIETKTPFSLLLLDIDHFKKVNDTYGHLVGDEVLKYLSKIIGECCGEDNLYFRYGGEEFCIIVKYKEELAAFKFAEQLRIKIAETNSPTGAPITISIGISSLQELDRHPKTIIERADTALYQSKSDGRNRTTIYPAFND